MPAEGGLCLAAFPRNSGPVAYCLHASGVPHGVQLRFKNEDKRTRISDEKKK